MADWTTLASLATAAGTLVLAVATFAAVRSANRSARIAEYSMRLQIQPLLMVAKLDDPEQKIGWADEHRAKLVGSMAHVELVDGIVYLAIPIRNAGAGTGVIQGWHLGLHELLEPHPHAEPDGFRPQSRDLYVPGGDIGFWQAAMRDREDPEYAGLVEAVRQRRRFSIELLYTDHQGQQPTITLYLLTPAGEDAWFASVIRHWNVDRPDPRHDGD